MARKYVCGDTRSSLLALDFQLDGVSVCCEVSVALVHCTDVSGVDRYLLKPLTVLLFSPTAACGFLQTPTQT